MNGFQIAYALTLVALTYPAWAGQRYSLLCLWANLLATLTACLAMDLAMISPDSARLWMMIADLSTGAALASRPGLSRVIAAGFALTIPLYVPSISGLFTRGQVDFTIVYIVNSLQLGALGLGSLEGGSGSGGGRVHRLDAGRLSMGKAPRSGRVSGGAISTTAFQGQEME